MAETVGGLLLCPFSLDAAHTLAGSDSRGALSVSINPTGTRYYTAFLRRSGWTGTSEALANGFLQHVQSQLGGPSFWTLAATSDGRCTITYKSTGTGALNAWGTNNIIRTLLGHDANVSLAQNASVTGTYPMPFVLAMIGRKGSRDWERRKPKAAYAVTETGLVYGWASSARQMSVSFDLEAHPRDWTRRTEYGSLATPVYPSTAARFLTPPTVAVTSDTVPALPWSVLDHVDASIGHDQTYVADWPSLQALSVTVVDIVQLDPETYLQDRMTQPMQGGWTGRSNVGGITLRLREKSVSL